MKKFFKTGLISLFFLSFFTFFGYGADEKIPILFVDRFTNQPIINHRVEIQQIIYCREGADCLLPILFTGITDEYGKVYVEKSVFNYYFNVVLSGYPRNGPFRKQKNSNVYIRRYSNGEIESFNYKIGVVIIKVSSRKEGMLNEDVHKKKSDDIF